ncbi:flagellar hook-associated protein FlgL|uniref:Flagellar hook-associated protein 3 FlgL n=1 Tax=Dendrosporobacter quercicolus TaxID=146817 RepID=A0A1G9WUV0_9FIRM|nr:flagellar hook-associated protein FlgL [Dendrosporobacter quercicolus]NSL49211.1 flagellar hook-associated protein FlgL [Dendrosporobacter quercicolus DSM 1736]SDM87883.1 flagellar hook-associated protein 3 FlgL [Dendrosporobacter quercicolus]
MRISNSIITYNFLSSLNKSMERKNAIQEQLSDGKAIHRPSDNPIKAVRSLLYNSNLGQNQQFTQNLKDAQSWMNTTDSAMSDLSSIMIDIKELVLGASNGTNPSDVVQTAGKSLDNLINQIVSLGNTKLGDRYVFSGQNDKTQPFERNGDVITYSGDASKISMPVQQGLAAPTRDSVNLTGVDVFGENGTAMLDRLIQIKQHLDSGTPEDQKWLSETGLAYIDQDHASILQQHTEMGTRMAAYEMTLNMMEDQSVVITEDIANTEDLDIPRAIIDFQNNDAIYKAALSVGSKIMPLSLVDFLR